MNPPCLPKLVEIPYGSSLVYQEMHLSALQGGEEILQCQSYFPEFQNVYMKTPFLPWSNAFIYRSSRWAFQSWREAWTPKVSTGPGEWKNSPFAESPYISTTADQSSTESDFVFQIPVELIPLRGISNCKGCILKRTCGSKNGHDVRVRRIQELAENIPNCLKY